VNVAVRVHRQYVMNANQREHWAVAGRKKRVLRDLGFATLKARRVAPMERASIQCFVRYPKLARRRDVHNLYPTAKHLIDGMVDAGLLPDDSDEYLIGPDMRKDPDPSRLADWFVFTFHIESF